jgi:hypothetical protein
MAAGEADSWSSGAGGDPSLFLFCRVGLGIANLPLDWIKRRSNPSAPSNAPGRVGLRGSGIVGRLSINAGGKVGLKKGGNSCFYEISPHGF